MIRALLVVVVAGCSQAPALGTVSEPPADLADQVLVDEFDAELDAEFEADQVLVDQLDAGGVELVHPLDAEFEVDQVLVDQLDAGGAELAHPPDAGLEDLEQGEGPNPTPCVAFRAGSGRAGAPLVVCADTGGG